MVRVIVPCDGGGWKDGREVVHTVVAQSTGLNPIQTYTKFLTFPGIGVFIGVEG